LFIGDDFGRRLGAYLSKVLLNNGFSDFVDLRVSGMGKIIEGCNRGEVGPRQWAIGLVAD
jgi:hypothetical protein